MENNSFNEKNSNDTNALFDLIQNIQSKLNDEQKNTLETNSNEINSQNFDKVNNSGNFDFSSIISMLNNNSGDANSNSNNNISSEDSSNFNFDVGTILKLQRIFSSLNANDPKKNLLLSLKPFLRKSRQDKLNEYITMLTIGNALGIFNSRGDKQNE